MPDTEIRTYRVEAGPGEFYTLRMRAKFMCNVLNASCNGCGRVRLALGHSSIQNTLLYVDHRPGVLDRMWG
jgi:hypothetical protein